eukprot:3408284-Amphidinium_carterae.1
MFISHIIWPKFELPDPRHALTQSEWSVCARVYPLSFELTQCTRIVNESVYQHRNATGFGELFCNGSIRRGLSDIDRTAYEADLVCRKKMEQEHDVHRTAGINKAKRQRQMQKTLKY